jgi:glycosyltransferase involved in cell wall biosynthesis
MTPETSIAFPPGDEPALEEAVVALLEDEPRRAAMGAAGRELMQQRYAWGSIASRLVDIYEAAAA